MNDAPVLTDTQRLDALAELCKREGLVLVEAELAPRLMRAWVLASEEPDLRRAIDALVHHHRSTLN